MSGKAAALTMIIAAAQAEEAGLLVAGVYTSECWDGRHDECDTPKCACGCHTDPHGETQQR